MFKRKFLKMVSIITLCSISIVAPGGNMQSVKAAANNEKNTAGVIQAAKVDNFDIQAKTQVEPTYNLRMDYDYGEVSEINEFWGADGNYHIVYSDENTVYISIVNNGMKLQKTLEIPKDLPIVGNAIQDKQGNYYIIYGKYDTAVWEKDANAGKAVVMSIVQYNQEGKQLNRLAYTGLDTGHAYSGGSFGTKEPFNFGTCDVIIDSQGILVCQYGRVMYNGHQSSHVLYVDTATMTRLNYAEPYTSHSFEQTVTSTSDGGYLFADRGDAYERGFTVTKVTKGSKNVTAFVPFHVRNGSIYQVTYATLAGIAEVSNGYALAGASEKTLTYEDGKDDFNESRNIFLQVFSKNFTSNSTNDPSTQLLNGDTRKAQGTYVSGTGKLQSGAVDYGVLWLTNYTGRIYASSPKMIDIGNDQLLLMWEKKKYTAYDEYAEEDYYSDAFYYDGEDYYDGDDFTEEEMEKYYSSNYESYSSQYIESCYMVVSGNGTVVIPETVIKDEHISEFGEPTYKDGCIYWTTSNGMKKTLQIHRLEIGKKMPAKIDVTSVKTDKDTITVAVGQKAQIKTTVSPSNADNKKVWYHYNKDIMTIDEKGNITGKKVGSSKIIVISEDNPKIFSYVTVHISNKAPGNFKVVQTASLYGDYSVKLSWSKTSNGALYEIYRSTSKDSGYDYIDCTRGLSYIDSGLKKNKKYYYKVRLASDSWDEDYYFPYSNTVMVYVLEHPNNVTVNKTAKTSAKITWSKVSSADGYEIYFYDSKAKKYVLLNTYKNNTKLSFTKTKLTTGQTYSFKVRTFKTVNKIKYYSDFSDIVKIKM